MSECHESKGQEEDGGGGGGGGSAEVGYSFLDHQAPEGFNAAPALTGQLSLKQPGC